MKIWDNGITRDMTAEEIEHWQQSMTDTPTPEPTTEDRIAALESTTDDIILMMADLIGGV